MTILITPELALAAETWRNQIVYFDGRNYRWTKADANLPRGAKSGRIVSFNRSLKMAFPDIDTFHRWAISRRDEGYWSDVQAQNHGWIERAA